MDRHRRWWRIRRTSGWARCQRSSSSPQGFPFQTDERPAERLSGIGRPSPKEREGSVVEGTMLDVTCQRLVPQVKSFFTCRKFFTRRKFFYLSKVGREAVMGKDLNFSFFSSSQKLWGNYHQKVFIIIDAQIPKYQNTCSAVCMISVEMGEYDSHNWLPCHLVVKISGERKNDKTCKVCMKLICLLFTISPLQMLRGPPWRPHSSRECQWWRRPPRPPAWCCSPGRNQSPRKHSDQLSIPDVVTVFKGVTFCINLYTKYRGPKPFPPIYNIFKLTRVVINFYHIFTSFLLNSLLWLDNLEEASFST